MKTIVVDIDGVLCNNTWGKYDKARPIQKNIDIIKPDTFDKYLGIECKFKIQKIDYDHKNIVISRKEFLLEELKERFYEEVQIGDIINGTVKNITDFGAFLV